MPKNFKIKEALKFGWDNTLEHIGFFVVALLCIWAVNLIPRVLIGSEGRGALGGILSLALFLVNTGVSLGFVKVSLKLLNKEEPAAHDFSPDWKQYWPFVAAAIIAAAVTVVGFILLIVPGIILAVGTQFYGYLLVERGLKPVAAVRASWQLTRGVRWKLFGFILLGACIILLGALALGVGLFLAMPTMLLAQAYVYRELSGQEPLPGV